MSNCCVALAGFNSLAHTSQGPHPIEDKNTTTSSVKTKVNTQFVLNILFWLSTSLASYREAVMNSKAPVSDISTSVCPLTFQRTRTAQRQCRETCSALGDWSPGTCSVDGSQIHGQIVRLYLGTAFCSRSSKDHLALKRNVCSFIQIILW